MIGNERRRYCGDCKLNVYNLSGMSRAEAESLIINAEGRLCVRFYRRADGSVLTKDCPVGWAAIKQRVSRVAVAMFSLLVGLMTGLGFASLFQTKRPMVLMGETVGKPNSNYLMGNFAVPTPTPKPKEHDALMGAIAIAPREKGKVSRN